MKLRDYPDGTHLVTLDHDDGTTEVALYLGDRMVSTTRIFPMRMRIGQAIVRMDGIGSVETDESHRKRGYSRRVLETAVDLMRAGDAALSTLYGIPDFYPKYGFATSGGEHTVVLTITDDDLPFGELPQQWVFRDWLPGDLQDVQRLYHRNTRLATGAVPRPGAARTAVEPDNEALNKVGVRAWNDLQRVGTPDVDDGCKVLVNPMGEVVAYAWIGRQGWWVQKQEDEVPGSFHLGEVMSRDPESAEVLLAACRQWARESRPDARNIEFIIPPEGPVAIAAAELGASWVARFTREGEFMARVLDTGRLISQLLPELSERARRSCATRPASLAIRTDEGEVMLSLGAEGASMGPATNGNVLLAEMPQTMLARLSLGAYPVRDLAARMAPEISPEVLDRLEDLFPQRHAHIYPMDRF